MSVAQPQTTPRLPSPARTTAPQSNAGVRARPRTATPGLALAPAPPAQAKAAAPQRLAAPASSWGTRLGESLLPPQLRPGLRQAARTCGQVSCGLGVVAGVSYGAAASGLTAALLKVFSGASILDRVGGSVPFIGPLLAVLMGVGGNFGFLSVGIIVQSLVDACFAGDDSWQDALRWFRVHAALGLSLSPLLLATASSCTPGVVAGVALGAAYLSYTVQRAHATGTPPSFPQSLLALGVSLGLAPVGAQAASHVAGVNIVRQAVNFPLLALGCNAIVSAGHHLYTLFGSNSAAGPGQTEPVALGDAVLYSGSNEAAATVFVPQDVAQAVGDIVARNKVEMERGINNGARCLLLRAPPGAGKRQVARCIAQALQTRLYVLERAAFNHVGGPHAGQVLAQQLQRWGEEAKQLGRPVVLYVPELLQLAPKVGDAAAAAGAGAGGAAPAAPVSDDFTSQLKTLMANEGGNAKNNLLFVLGTTATSDGVRAGVDEAIANRITRSLRWQAPDAALLTRVWRQKVRRALQRSVLHPPLYAALGGDALNALLQDCVLGDELLRRSQRAAMVPGDVEARVAEAVDETVEAYLAQRNPQLAPDEADTRFDVAPVLRGALARSLARWLHHKEAAAGPAPRANGHAAGGYDAVSDADADASDSDSDSDNDDDGDDARALGAAAPRPAARRSEGR